MQERENSLAALCRKMTRSIGVFAAAQETLWQRQDDMPPTGLTLGSENWQEES